MDPEDVDHQVITWSELHVWDPERFGVTWAEVQEVLRDLDDS